MLALSDTQNLLFFFAKVSFFLVLSLGNVGLHLINGWCKPINLFIRQRLQDLYTKSEFSSSLNLFTLNVLKKLQCRWVESRMATCAIAKHTHKSPSPPVLFLFIIIPYFMAIIASWVNPQMLPLLLLEASQQKFFICNNRSWQISFCCSTLNFHFHSIYFYWVCSHNAHLQSDELTDVSRVHFAPSVYKKAIKKWSLFSLLFSFNSRINYFAIVAFNKLQFKRCHELHLVSKLKKYKRVERKKFLNLRKFTIYNLQLEDFNYGWCCSEWSKVIQNYRKETFSKSSLR